VNASEALTYMRDTGNCVRNVNKTSEVYYQWCQCDMIQVLTQKTPVTAEVRNVITSEKFVLTFGSVKINDKNMEFIHYEQ
jgi:hypothetical protein